MYRSIEGSGESPEPSWLNNVMSTIWASTQENLSSGVCEQQHGRRPACPPAQTDQCLYYSLIEKYHIMTYYKRNFNFLGSLCSWRDWFEAHFFGNPEDRFSRDKAHLMCWFISLFHCLYRPQKVIPTTGQQYPITSARHVNRNCLMWLMSVFESCACFTNLTACFPWSCFKNCMTYAFLYFSINLMLD